MKKLVKFIVVLSSMILIFILLGVTGYYYPTDTLAMRYKEQGIDISHHQIRINWKHVDNKKYKFVIMKATEGKDFLDTDFFYNWTNAQLNGLKVGAYHFFTMTSSGKDQAKYYISKVPNIDNSIPPVIDIEISSKYLRSEVNKELKDMIDILENYYKKRVILYVTYKTYNSFVKGEFSENPIWISDKKFYPKLPDGKEWSIWQYSSRGRIAGIEGFTDKNTLNEGTIDEFIEKNRIK